MIVLNTVPTLSGSLIIARRGTRHLADHGVAPVESGKIDACELNVAVNPGTCAYVKPFRVAVQRLGAAITATRQTGLTTRAVQQYANFGRH